MTPVPRRSTRPHDPDLAPLRQARYWDRRYISDPTFFGAGPSRFLRWTLARLRPRSVGRNWLELGSGYGRDLAALRARGFSVRGVDVSRIGTTLARRAKLAAVEAPALEYLPSVEAGSVDVVYSNLFLNMEFTEAEHGRLFDEVYRVLVPGGFHAYSVRSVADPWYGRGPRTGADSFDLAPEGPVIHFFSQEYAAKLRRGRFRCLESWEGVEGREFPITVLYVLEQKSRAGGPRGPGRSRLTPS